MLLGASIQGDDLQNPPEAAITPVEHVKLSLRRVQKLMAFRFHPLVTRRLLLVQSLPRKQHVSAVLSPLSPFLPSTPESNRLAGHWHLNSCLFRNSKDDYVRSSAAHMFKLFQTCEELDPSLQAFKKAHYELPLAKVSLLNVFSNMLP
jgi:hypothetical protein